MKKYFFLILLAAVLYSCKKDPDSNVSTTNDNSVPSGAVIKSQKISKSSNQVYFDLDFVVFNNKTTVNTSLAGNNFSLDAFSSGGNNFSFTRNSTSLQNGVAKGAYSACLLLDQSGSIATTDPNNDRIEAAKIFCQSLGTGDNMFLSAFAGGGSRRLPYETTIYGSGFTTNGSSYLSNLDDLKTQVGGNTPLYKSAYTMIDYTKQHAPSANKALIIFTDGDDSDGGKTSTDVINNATAQGVKVYAVGLSTGNVSELAGIANKTGGSFMFAQDARQLISMFGNLGKLLDGTSSYYHTNWALQSTSTLPASGSFTTKVKVTLGNGSYVYIPFRVDF